MALEDGDILFGRLAIGRGALSRPDARALAREVEAAASHGRRESLPAAAVRLGYLQRKQVQALEEALAASDLLCRGPCQRRVPLGEVRARAAFACPACGGPQYVAAPLPAGEARSAAAAAPPAEGQPGGSSGRTFMELTAARVPEPAPAAPGAGDAGPFAPATASAAADDDAGGGRTFLELEAPLLPARPADDERTVELSDPLGAPTPIRAALPAALAETWRSEPAAEPAFEPFSLGPDLQVVAPIGRGGMGTVYRGQTGDGRPVAVKVLNAQAGEHPDAVARFEREVKLAGALDHPHIVRVYAAGVVPSGPAAGRPYFTMDYVAGRDLAAWAQQRRRAPAAQVALIAAVCDAMDYAHGRGVVHRDLKPANVLVTHAEDAPRVCDFGLARYGDATHSLTRTGDIIGTPSYMPPEQALGDRTQIGPPTDVYALGALLYYLLTGRPPFAGPTSFAVIDKVVRQPPEPPSRSAPDVSADLEQVVLRALEKAPVDRFHTAGALAQALRALQLE